MQPARCSACNGRQIENFCAVRDRILPNSQENWGVRRCAGCGFGWTHPPPAPESLAARYPASYLGDTARMLDEFVSGKLAESRSWRGETEKVGVVQSFVTRGKLLDIGCGDAKFLLALDPKRWTRTGVDFARETLSLVAGRISTLRLVAGGIESVQPEEARYDAVTFWHVLEHLPDPEQALRKAGALLRSKGWIFVSAPNLGSLQASLFRKYWYGFDDVPRHLHHFSKRSLEHFLKRAGFEIRRHLFFSRRVNFHSLKHSLIHWSEDNFNSRIPYYALKPLLFAFPLVEQLTGRYGIMTTVAQKP